MSTKTSILQAVIVDLDGTMLDTLGDIEVALKAMLEELELPSIDRSFVRHTLGKGADHLVRSTLAHVHAPVAWFDRARASYQHHYLRINGDHVHVYPGVVEALRGWQARGLKLACLTNKPAALAMPLLQKMGLSGYFLHTFGGDSFERQKPDPLPLLKTCEALAAIPEHTLMVGDSTNDAAAARAAGCPVVLVSYGYNHGQSVSEVDADGVVDRMDAIIA